MRFRVSDGGSGRRGFSLVELAIVLTIASILIGVMIPQIQDTFHQREVNGVRDGVILLAAQARARAMEQARTVEFHLDVDNGTASVVDSGETIDELRFRDENGVSASASPSSITLCYTSRGFATQPCSTAISGTTDVVFSRAGHEAELEIWQLGQLRKS